MATPLRLTEIRIFGLFGDRTFRVPIETSLPTVLTGGNGTGKSTILRLIHAIASGDLIGLADAPLERMDLVFSEGETISLNRRAAGRSFELSWRGHRALLPSTPGINQLPKWARELLAENNFDAKLAQVHAFDRGRDLRMSFQESKRVRDLFGEMSQSASGKSEPPTWVEELRAAFDTVFVTDQRLIAEQDDSPRASPSRRLRSAVELASADLGRRIRFAESEYARVSQRQDRSLPALLLRAMQTDAEPGEGRVKSLLEDVTARRNRLRRVGLLDSPADGLNFPEASIQDPNQRRVVQAALTSDMKKLESLESLGQSLLVFASFLERRFRGKFVSLERDRGLTFRNSRGQVLEPSQMSSGEQQLLILAYEIIFRTHPGTLVIVDEPEISLHVLWQDTLLTDLAEMGKVAGVQFLMASHSPTIIARHPECERSLTGLARA